MSHPSTVNTAILHRGMPLYWPSRLSFSFLHSQGFIWNGIVASTRILIWLTPILFFFIQSFSLVSNYKLNSLLTPSFYKIQSLISFPLSSGITFLFHAVCFPSPHDADVGENRLHDQLLKGMFVCEARSWDYCFMLVRFPFISVLPF